MRFLQLVFRLLIYIFVICSLVFFTVSLKLIANLIGEELIYNILIIGEFIAIFQVVEFANIIIFAVLGMGFGVASVILPKICQLKTSAVLLIIIVPLIFSITPILKYNTWVKEIADNEKLTYQQAQDLSNSFLKSRINLEGFLGFYSYSAQFPVLPRTKKEMVLAVKLEKKVRYELTSLTKDPNLSQQKVSIFLAYGNWAIRFFYFSLSVFTTIAHFHIGRQTIEKQLIKARTPMFPPIPHRHQMPQNKTVRQPVPQRGKPKAPPIPHRSQSVKPELPRGKLNK
ncbi:hypothetical protein IQ264_21110 [Phormidium sp. LEGE 05292]|uniref:hypothetical protein n=1 Tax=[Phormidium] sp. LEGE 05292 TaxID=767427 RepID=UPI00187FB932|nr:hypothetical protein [Phormidium sp. LEGE 05292]MBE9227925.1 hypothetical protein [Phormidium sp. LEGE 05292]